jgi:hypothetical protein
MRFKAIKQTAWVPVKPPETRAEEEQDAPALESVEDVRMFMAESGIQVAAEWP